MSATIADDDRLVTREEAAKVLGLRPNTLGVWACRKRGGPPFVRVGLRAVRYRMRDLREYLAARTVEPSAGAAVGK